MIRVPIFVFTFFAFLLSTPTAALAATSAAMDELGGALACGLGRPDQVATGEASPSMGTSLGRSGQRAPDPVVVPPGTGLIGEDWPIVSQSSYTYMDGEIQHTVTTTVQRGVRPGMSIGAAGGGHMPSISAAAICSYTGTSVITQQDVGCAGWCEYQYLRRTADTYTQGGSYNYFDRIETRNWWTRTITTPYLGTAHTQWNEEIAVDCDYFNRGRTVYYDWAPQWYTWDRTYDYYWDETALPIVSPGNSGASLFVYTDTPLLYNSGSQLKTLHTEISLK